MLSERVDIASFSRLIIREPSGALISRFLSDVGGVGTVEVGGFCFLEFLGLHMGVDSYDVYLYSSGFPFRNL